MKTTPYYFEVTPNNWEEAKLIGKLIRNRYIFRGQADRNWVLETSLHRSVTLNPQPNLTKISEIEQRVLKLFRLRAHQYIQSPPNDSDHIEWLSIIQDYGGPSRLLDFSESFYVASFFALESAREVASVWAINHVRLLVSLIFGKDKSLFSRAKLIANKKYIGEIEEITRFAELFVDESVDAIDFVLKVVPPRLNERLAVQKGLFLFPCNIEKSFENNLCSGFEFPFDTLESTNAQKMGYQDFVNEMDLIQKEFETGGGHGPNYPPVIKINLDRKLRKDALSDLHDMNIDYASLFPGLEGFAKSLNYRIGSVEAGAGSLEIRTSGDESQAKG